MYFLLNVSIFRLNVSFLHFLAWKASSAGLLKAGLMALLSHNINTFIFLTGFHHFLFIYFFYGDDVKRSIMWAIKAIYSIIALNLITSLLEFALQSVRRNLIPVTTGSQ